jgi:hypothetical protein
MRSRFSTSRLHHSGLSITKTRKLRRGKRWRGGADVVVAEAAAAAEAAEAVGAAEGAAADRLRLLTPSRRPQIQVSRESVLLSPGAHLAGFFRFAALPGSWRMSQSGNA